MFGCIKDNHNIKYYTEDEKEVQYFCMDCKKTVWYDKETKEGREW